MDMGTESGTGGQQLYENNLNNLRRRNRSNSKFLKKPTAFGGLMDRIKENLAQKYLNNTNHHNITTSHNKHHTRSPQKKDAPGTT